MLQAYLNLGFEVFLKNRFRTSAFLSELQKQSAIHRFDLTEDQVNRIKLYTIQSNLTNNWFGTLTGHKPGRDAIQKGLYLGALTPALDGLTDDFGFRYADTFEGKEIQDTSTVKHIRLARVSL